MSYEDLRGLRVLITGASGGIGSACAEAFARNGCRLILTGRDAERLHAVSDRALEEGALEAHWIAADITEDSEREKLLEQSGMPHVLVNNAGTNSPRRFPEASLNDYDLVFSINVRSLFGLTRSVVKGMLRKKIAGRIVNISSQAGLVGLPDRSVYCASKHAVEGFTKAVAVDLKGTGIRINNVAPTFVETDFAKATLSIKDFRRRIDERILLNDLPGAIDVAHAVTFLSSDASRYITGSTLPVDAGWTAN